MFPPPAFPSVSFPSDTDPSTKKRLHLDTAITAFSEFWLGLCAHYFISCFPRLRFNSACPEFLITHGPPYIGVLVRQAVYTHIPPKPIQKDQSSPKKFLHLIPKQGRSLICAEEVVTRWMVADREALEVCNGVGSKPSKTCTSAYHGGSNLSAEIKGPSWLDHRGVPFT